MKFYDKFINENNKNDDTVMWSKGDYKIVTSTPTNPDRISLWCGDKNVGNMYFSSNIELDDEVYTKISSVGIDDKHRGKGLGKRLYEIALKCISSDGIASLLVDRSNKKQVPSIYKRLNSFEKDGYSIIPKNVISKGEISYKDINVVASEFGVKPSLIQKLIDELKFEESNRMNLKSLNKHLKFTISYGIEYIGSMSPKKYGYGRVKSFQLDLEKLSNMSIDDLIN